MAQTATHPSAQPGRPSTTHQTHITVLVVDADSGEPLQTLLLAGNPGDPVSYNFHELTLPFVKAGYSVVVDPATALTAFPAADRTLEIHVAHQIPADFVSALPSEYQKLVPALSGYHAKTQPGSKRRTAGETNQDKANQVLTTQRIERPMVFAPFGMSLSQHHGNGGGAPNPEAGAAMLSAYWESLSGVINFGIQG
ncbi:hypothetical protein ACFQ3L_04585 [Lacticaseibacillus jixianensis]|uniref:Mucin binding domain-containing protein n=1 Tax=Lacticaseibacillus jixianensis TaxID=2486012 RepID=A0ABW4B746_9LACO|nr:hypothetical protein [Lacticaseibacillus jixianensis]